jgi:hypothetical protein
MMIETEYTPNPDTLKFLPGKKVSDIGPLEFSKNEKNIKVPLANKILSLDGTLMVFFGENFITVKKEKNLNWENLKHGIISEINHYYSQGNDVVVKKNLIKSTLTPKVDESEPASSNDAEAIVAVIVPKGIVKDTPCPVPVPPSMLLECVSSYTYTPVTVMSPTDAVAETPEPSSSPPNLTSFE